MLNRILLLIVLVLCACNIGPSIEQPDDGGSVYPTAWVKCVLVHEVRNNCGVLQTYQYDCTWSDSDCAGNIGDPSICLSSESPCPEDYGQCQMDYDRSGATCNGNAVGLHPTKPYNCIY